MLLKNSILSHLFVFLIAVFIILFGCEEFVNGVDPYIDQIEDEVFDDPDMLEFLVKGIKNQFAEVYGNLSLLSGGLSDELEYDLRVQNSSWPPFKEIDEGDITLNNSDVNDLFKALAELRFLSDNLIERVQRNGTSGNNEETALYSGYLYSGLARYFYASYFGLNPDEGGGVVDGGPFIPSSEMYNLAIEKLMQAFNYVRQGSWEERLINSLIARCYLYQHNFENALSFGNKGLNEEDSRFDAFFGVPSVNPYWEKAGNGRTQYIVNERFSNYITDDSLEYVRIPITEAEMLQGMPFQLYMQDKYPEDESSIPVITWQENELIIAECEFELDNGNPLDRLNSIRLSHGLDNLTEVTLHIIYSERDKELFCQGARLIDQRRYVNWHLDEGLWMFLPIPESERLINPNI